MAGRSIMMDGQLWEVGASGRVTQYGRDEFGVQFRQLGGTHEVRVARYAPLGSRIPEDSLATLADYQLRELFQRSQPSWTSPETEYRR